MGKVLSEGQRVLAKVCRECKVMLLFFFSLTTVHNSVVAFNASMAPVSICLFYMKLANEVVGYTFLIMTCLYQRNAMQIIADFNNLVF